MLLKSIHQQDYYLSIYLSIIISLGCLELWPPNFMLLQIGPWNMSLAYQFLKMPLNKETKPNKMLSNLY